MTTYHAVPASPGRYGLAEGPVQDEATETLTWVDIVAGEVHQGRLSRGVVETERRVQVDSMVGAALPSADGRVLVAGLERLWVLHPDGSIDRGPRVLPPGTGRRLNDAACDPEGRLVVGTLSLSGSSTTESLLRVEDDGSLTVLDEDLAQSNGLAWSADGTTLYSVDTIPGHVWARDYDARTGRTGPRRLHLRVEGYADGIGTDTDGNVWVAVWGAGRVLCHAPDGSLLHTVEVAAPHSSSLAFVGPELRTLLLTTASVELDEAQLARYPDSGRLFVAEVEATGVPATPWNGRLPSSPFGRQEH
ncbi:SMP-30/gluconolactonase/LRE family protein [Actinotalea sp.]|uniref:SMP-30/gluconolactonase/LRE family protein n=1 Tax=Actinotalea sp. TaxID=1872145 RepID=UPI00356962C0